MDEGLHLRRMRQPAIVLPARPSRRRRPALHIARADETPRAAASSNPRGSLVAASALLGIGLGGFVDCIVFHQMLPLHDILRPHMPAALHLHGPLNLLWDGLFHATTWLMTALGLGLLWDVTGRADTPPPTRVFLAGIALGWGLFNCVEGLRMMGLSHVLERGPEVLGDAIFIASGAPLLAVGLLLLRAGQGIDKMHAPAPLALRR